MAGIKEEKKIYLVGIYCRLSKDDGTDNERDVYKRQEMCVPTNGELYSSDTACSGDIVILPNDVLQLNSILGNEIPVSYTHLDVYKRQNFSFSSSEVNSDCGFQLGNSLFPKPFSGLEKV